MQPVLRVESFGYNSRMSKAKKKLAELQMIESGKYPPRHFPSREDLIAKYKKAWSKADFEKNLPLLKKSEGYESFTFILETDAARLRQAASVFGWKLPEPVILGTLPYGSPFAYVETFGPPKEFLIVFSEAMFLFLYVSAKAVASCLRFKHKRGALEIDLRVESAINAIENNPKLLPMFEDILLCTLFEKHTGVFASAQHIVNPTRQFFAIILTDISEVFLLGHEFAHAMGKDSGTDGMENDAVVIHNIPEYDTNWKSELRADTIGAILAIEVGFETDIHPTASIMGIDFCLTMLDILVRGVHIAKGEFECTSMECKTHPPLSLRRECFRRFAKENMRHHEIDFDLESLKAIESIIEYLWSRTKPSVLKMAADGVALSPLWNEA